MTDQVKLTLDQADNKQLRYYATTILNIDVPPVANDGQLRAKILQAKPELTEIIVPASLHGMTASAPAAQSLPATGTSDRISAHFSNDPKVEIEIMTTTDSTRPKDVQLAVQGDVIILKRGKRIKIPYRHFLALEQAIENVARDTDEISPQTGLPIKEWVEQASYPYQVYSRPSDEEIAAWTKRTAGMALE